MAASYTGEKADLYLTTTPLLVVVEKYKVSPEPPFLQNEQSQLPRPFLIMFVLQTPHQLRCPSLDMLQCLNVFLVVRTPKQNTVLEV